MPPTRLVILGDPVAHSRSPGIHAAAIAAAGLNVKYDAMRVASSELQSVARQLANEGAGGNVTVPHKIAFRRLCARVTPTAERTDAVNTFWTENGTLIGDNTDVGGFDVAARAAMGELRANLTIGLVGAGGAAAAVLAAIESWPDATAKVFSRNRDRSEALGARFSDFARVVSTVNDAVADSDFVVNATPLGMTDDSLPFNVGDLMPSATVMDLVYKSGGTALTRAAIAAGHPAVDGTGMLIEQAALAFERWFGFPPDKSVMRAALA